MYRKAFELPVVPKDAYAALTEPGPLGRWFAEHVEIDLRVGGAYRFWGRHTLWVPTRAEAGQCIQHIEAERALDFSWSWRGCASLVELRLEAAPGGTRLIVSHSFQPLCEQISGESRDGEPAAEAPRYLPIRTAREMADSDDPERDHDLIVDAFWDLSIANLRHYLEERAPFLLPLLDGSLEVGMTIVIRSTPARVFQALTSARGLVEWMGAEAPEVELIAGGTYSYGWQVGSEGRKVEAGPRRIVELIPDRLLVHDWFWPGEPRSEVRWELEAIDEGTRLHLRHSGFASEPESYKLGWASGLGVLARQLEGHAESSWLSQER